MSWVCVHWIYLALVPEEGRRQWGWGEVKKLLLDMSKVLSFISKPRAINNKIVNFINLCSVQTARLYYFQSISIFLKTVHEIKR